MEAFNQVDPSLSARIRRLFSSCCKPLKLRRKEIKRILQDKNRRSERMVLSSMVAMLIALCFFPYFYFLVFQGSTRTDLQRFAISFILTLLLMLVFGLGNVYSRRIRCVIIMALPTLCTARGRAILISIALGILLNGPVMNLMNNIQEVPKSSLCFQNNTVTVVKQFVDSTVESSSLLKRLVNAIKRTTTEKLKKLKNEANDKIQKLKDKYEQLKATYRVLKKIKDFFRCMFSSCDDDDDDLNTDQIRKIDLNKVDSSKQTQSQSPITFEESGELEEIRKQVTKAIITVFMMFRNTMGTLRKLLYIVIFWVFISSYNYLDNYYTDTAFDNNVVDYRVCKLDNEKQKRRTLNNKPTDEAILPLRRWENNVYITRNSPILRQQEIISLIITVLILLPIAAIIIGVLVADYGLEKALTIIKDYGEFNITVNRNKERVYVDENAGPFFAPELNLAVTSLNCLPNPTEPNPAAYVAIATIFVICVITALLQAYALRLRAVICDLFYPEIAEERVTNLYSRIKQGRLSRRIKLHKLLEYEHYRRKRAIEFAFPVLRQYRQWRYKGLCPTCSFSLEDRIYEYKDKRGQLIKVCRDCWKDFNIKSKGMMTNTTSTPLK